MLVDHGVVCVIYIYIYIYIYCDGAIKYLSHNGSLFFACVVIF